MNTELKTERLLTRRELAEYLSVSENSVDRYVKYDRLPFIRLGKRSIRFRRGSVDLWIEERETT